MDKNSLPEAKEIRKGRLALLLLLAIIGGMLGARFVASLATILFGLNALWDVHPRRWLRERWWLFGLVWVLMYALSYFWSADAAEWFAHLQVKFPFLFLPLAFAFLPRFRASELRLFTWGLLGLMCAGAVYSLSYLWRTPANDLITGYKYAHVLPTPFYNDHIAFSAAVALTIAWAMFCAPLFIRRRQKILLCLGAFFLAAYLHILAAKTGLVSLYILLLGVSIYHLKQSPGRGMLQLAGIALAITAAFITLPTLRERAGYSIVTWRSYVMGERNGIYSDAGRIISYDLACRSIARHPWAGVGAGDVFSEMKAGYARRYPEVPEAQKLWPHNQYLTAAMSAGIPTALLLLLWQAAPLRRVRRNRSSFYFVMVWIMLLIPLMIDLFLEVQMGVAVFLIFLLLQRKAMMDFGSKKPNPTRNPPFEIRPVHD